MDGIAKKTDEIMSFFSGNPFTTPVGQKIEQATDSGLASENWGLNMEICDLVNMSEDGAKDAVRAIRKRLQQNAGKNYTVIMYTLTVLETCVKNCGRRFHILVCHKDFVLDLVKLIGPKNDPPSVVQEKILGLIQSWADTFNGPPELSGVVQVYQDLKFKGIEFPMTDLDSMAPILTPKRSVESEPILHPVDLGERQMTGENQTKISPEQAVKIRRDLDVVQGNMAVFSEMLSEMKPGQENPADLELLQELYTTCSAMQRRIAELLCTIQSDELTAEMLHINDELNNLFLRYGRYKKNIEKTGVPPGSVKSPSGQHQEPSLIDFGSELQTDAGGEPSSRLPSKMGGLSVRDGPPTGAIPKAPIPKTHPAKEDADFDMFAQSRTASYEKTKISGSTYADNTNVDQVSSLGAAALNKEVETHKQSDFDEMEAWLRTQRPGDFDEKPGAAGGGEASLTSSEFDKFLAERAAAVSGEASGVRPSSGKMDKEKTDKMFAL